MTRFVRQCKIFNVENCATPETPPLCPLKTVRAQYGCLLFNCTQEESPSDSGSSDLGTDSLVAIWLTGAFLLILLALILGFALWAVCSKKRRWPRWPLICVLLNLMNFVLGSQQIFRFFGMVFAHLPGVVRNRIKRILSLLFKHFLQWVFGYIWNCTPPRRALEFVRPEEDPEMGLSAPIPPESNSTANLSFSNRTLSSSLPNFSKIFRFSTPRRNRTPVKQQDRLYPDLASFFHPNNTNASSSSFTNSILSPSLRPSAPNFSFHPQSDSVFSPSNDFFSGPTSTPHTLQFPPTPSFFYNPDNFPEADQPMDTDFHNNGFQQDSITSPQSPPRLSSQTFSPDYMELARRNLPQINLDGVPESLARYLRPANSNPPATSNTPVRRHLDFEEFGDSPETVARSRLCPSCTACLTNTNLQSLSCICSLFHQTPPPLSSPVLSPPSLDISDHQQISFQTNQEQIESFFSANSSFGNLSFSNTGLRFLDESIQISQTTSVQELSAAIIWPSIFRRTVSTPTFFDYSYPRAPIRKRKRNREIGIDVNNILLPRLRKKTKKDSCWCD